jgi:hypothetical protein
MDTTQIMITEEWMIGIVFRVYHTNLSERLHKIIATDPPKKVRVWKISFH